MTCAATHVRCEALHVQLVQCGGLTRQKIVRDHDHILLEVRQILAEWNAADSFTNRVAAIRAGTGGVPKLDATTVTDDGVRDDLWGNAGLTWFWMQPPDVVHDLKAADVKN